MKIIPLAFESLGADPWLRSLKPTRKILIDPGTSIAPERFGYPPWKDEFDSLYEIRARIEEYTEKVNITTISHYYHGYYTPFELGKFLDSSPQVAEKVYQGKKLFIKHPFTNQ